MTITLLEREILEIFTQISPLSLENKFASLFPYRYDPIMGVGNSVDGTGVSWITAQKYLTDNELFLNWSHSNKFVGVTFGKTTKYALIDIDAGSQYDSHSQMMSIEAALSKVGINQVNWYKSSGSEGWHGYIPFNQVMGTWDVAVVLTQVLTTKGFTIDKGQLELFPNTKSWGSKYHSHRLPLQAGFEYSKEELCWFISDWEEAAVENDADLFNSYRDEARKWFKSYKGVPKNTSKPPFAAKGEKSTLWYNNLQATLKEGWTATSQTNSIIGDIAALHRVFTKASSVEELALMIIETATTLPGYEQYCNHKHEIDKRCTEWSRCAWKKYRPIGSANQKVYVKKTEEENCNLTKLKEVRAKIADALVKIRESGFKVTYRLLASEANVSLSTINKHKDLLTHSNSSLDSSTVSSLDGAADSHQALAVVEGSKVKEIKEPTCSPHLIEKRCEHFKLSKLVNLTNHKLKIKVKGLKIIYFSKLQVNST